VDGVITRRRLVAGGAAALACAAACADARADASSDGGELQKTLEVEQLVVISYRRALAGGALAAAVEQRVRTLLAQELDHVATLELELDRRGVAVPNPPTAVSAVQAALARHQLSVDLTRLHTQHDYLRLLIDVETVVEAAYFAAISKLGDASLVRLCVEAMGGEAQHWTVLSALQHPGQVAAAVPYAFVRGSSGI
jgi:hypothetical protein